MDVLERLKPSLQTLKHTSLPNQKKLDQISEISITPDTSPESTPGPVTEPVYRHATEGQKFDIVFCGPENLKTRLQYIHRLSDEEKEERRLRFGLEKTINCLFPKEYLNQPGFKTYATMTVRKLYGAPYFIDYKNFYDYLDTFYIKPGLVGANIKPEFFELDDYVNNMYTPDLEREEFDRSQRQDILVQEQEQDLNNRYLLFIAYRIGLKDVPNIPYQVLIDLISTALGEPGNEGLPDVESWKALHRKDVTLPPIKPGRDEDFDRFVGQLQANYTTKQTVKKSA